MTDPTRSDPDRFRYARSVAAAGVLPLVIAVVGAVLVWSWRGDLPSSVAIHWGADGVADDFASIGAVVWLLVGCGVVMGGAGLALGLAARAEAVLTRTLAATAAGTTAFVTMLTTTLVGAQRGAADVAAAELSVVNVLGALAFAAVVAAVAVWIVPGRAVGSVESMPEGAPRLAVEVGERVMWRRSVATASLPAAMLVAAIGITITVSVLSRLWWMIGLSVLLTVLVVLMYSITVTIDRHGLTVRSRFGWPRLRVQLDEIAHATVVDVRPIRDFGGYGYRLAVFGPLRGAWGFVVRGGQGMLVERGDGHRTVVVVDDAATAAGLLNSMVERQR